VSIYFGAQSLFLVLNKLILVLNSFVLCLKMRACSIIFGDSIIYFGGEQLLCLFK
jgi:hypothetical protein